MGFGAIEAIEATPSIALAILLGPVGYGGPGARYVLQVEGATVEAIPVTDGERGS